MSDQDIGGAYCKHGYPIGLPCAECDSEPIPSHDAWATVKQLTEEIADNERWMREVLTDFRIPFDDHKIGRRLAFTQWMRDKNQK